MKKKICFILFASFILMTTLFASTAFGQQIYCLNTVPVYVGTVPCPYDDNCIQRYYKRTSVVNVGEEAPGSVGTHLCVAYHTTCGLFNVNVCPYPDW